MKTRILLVFTVLLFCFSAKTFAQDWETGSGLMSSGSGYTSSVGGVGSEAPEDMYTVSHAPRARRDGEGTSSNDSDWPDDASGTGEGDTVAPIGSSAVLLVFAALAAAVVAWRERKARA